MNDIDICTADILNAYLQAPSSEKYYIPKCGLEFGLENLGKRANIARTPYGGKSSGRDFHNHLRSYNTQDFISYDWSPSEFGDIQEALPMKASEPRGMGFCMTAHIDADHAGNVVTRQSRTRFIIYFSIILQYIGCQRSSRA